MRNKASKPNRSIWLCDLTHSYQTIAMTKMPLGIGMIAAYCKKEIQTGISIHLFKFIDELREKLKNTDPPLVIGFANYAWSHNLNCEISKRLKKQYPKTCIVFGGPQFPSDSSKQMRFFTKNPWIDFFIPFEGEAAFLELTKLLLQYNGDVEKVKCLVPKNTIFYKNHKLVQGELLPRVNLPEVPSPYLKGFFDKYFGKLTPMVQTTRGCPFCCAYCHDGLAHWSRIIHRDKTLYKELEYIAQKCRKSDHLYITDANFGMYAQDLEVCRVIAKLQDKYSWPWLISVNTGKNNKEQIFEAAKITRGAMKVTAALQSTNPIVLQNVRRKNLPLQDIIKLVKKTKALSAGAGSNSDLILGLPGDTKQAHFQSVKDVVDSGIDEITSLQFMLLPSIELASKEAQKKYQMTIKYRVLPRCFGRYFWNNNDDILTSEIEIICVANNTLSFEDYLECRVLDLTIAIFYNYSIFADLYRILSDLGFSVFNFILELQSRARKSDMKTLYDKFINETQQELWDSPEKILAFIKKPGVLEKYRKGEYGANLIFKYQVLAHTHYIEKMIDITYKYAAELIKTNKQTKNMPIPNIFDFLKELKQFHRALICDFLNGDKRFEYNFHYNILEFHTQALPLSKVKKMKQQIIIKHTQKQKNIIAQNLKRRGGSLIGLSQMFSQIPLSMLLRKPILEK